MESKVSGIVTDRHGNPLTNLSVECFSVGSTSDNYLGSTVTDTQGKFEFIFNFEPTGTGFEIDLTSNEISKVNERPGIYVTVKNSKKRLYKSDVFTGSTEIENLKVVIDGSDLTFFDPYANSFQREVGLILANVTPEVVDLSQVDPTRAAQQMIRIFGNLLYYNVRGVQHHGYPGPQVPRYPKRTPHKHSLPWNRR